MKKILLVEDETSLREVYAEILIDSGYEVAQAGDGDTAWEMIKSANWDLLLLDIMLPKLDGMDVLKHAEQDPTIKGKPIIVISNLDTDDIVKQCLHLGAAGYLIKSNITPQDIVNTVKNNLEHA